MKRLLITSLAFGLASAMSVAAASANWLAAPELHYSPVPRERHGKAGVAKARRAARKHKRRRAAK